MQGQTYSDIIKMEHRKVDALFEQFRSGTSPEMKQNIAYLITKELSQHAAKEEMIVYPVMKKRLGSQLSNHALEEHQGMKETLYELDNMKVTDPGYDAKMEALIADVQHHVKEEEDEMMAKLDALLTHDEAVELGRSFLASESAAPTRPHPDAPNQPPMNFPANVAAKGMDAMKDTARFANMKDAEKQALKEGF